MYPLLTNAPPHDSPEFMEYLKKNNNVVLDGTFWLIIENCKYHRPDRKWYTAFSYDPFMVEMTDLEGLVNEFGHLEWKKKAASEQTVKRFHIHMYE